MRLLTLRALSDLLGGRSRSSIYRDLEAGRLPTPVRIGRRLYWRDAEITAWIAALEASR
jgi:prophage regulatory protein